MAAGFDHDALFEQGGNVFGEGFGAADVGDRDLGAAAAQKQGRGQAGFAQSDDQNLFAFEFHHGIIPQAACDRDFSIVHRWAAWRRTCSA